MLVAVALVGSGCSGAASGPAEESLETVKEDVLTVATDASFPPMEFKKAGGKTLEGFDIDLLNEVGERLSLESVEFIDQQYVGLFTGLQGGKWDVIASAIIPNEVISTSYELSVPYLEARQALLINTSVTPAVTNVSQIGSGPIGVVSGSGGERWGAKNLTARSLKLYSSTNKLFEDLHAGRVKGVLYDRAAAFEVARGGPNFKVVQVIETGDEYVLVFRQDADPLREKVNQTLKQIQEDGTLNRLMEKWFGSEG